MPAGSGPIHYRQKLLRQPQSLHEGHRLAIRLVLVEDVLGPPPLASLVEDNKLFIACLGVRLGPSDHLSFPDAWAQIGIRGDSTRAARAAPSSSSVTTGWTGRGTQTSDPCWGQKPDKSNNPVEGGCLFHQQASDGGQRL